MSYLDILNETRQNMATANPFENIMRGAQGFNKIQNQLLQNQQAEQTLEQNAAMNPLLMQSRQAEVQGQQIQNEAGQLKIDDFQKKERLGQLYRASQALKPFVEKGDLQGASTVAAKLTDFGLPEETAAEVQRLVQIGDADTIRGHINTIESLAAQDLNKGDTAELETFNKMAEGLSPEDRLKAQRIRLGLETGAGRETYADREARDPDLAITTTAIQSDRSGRIAESKTRAELMTELDLKPSVQAKVEEAVLTARQDAAKKDEKRSNARAFSTYESAMNQLMTALGDTDTGPFIGRIPALTANQQMADGALAAMAPIMKDIFRTAGEGAFTNVDQEWLIATLPTRKMEPEARAFQMATVDGIIRSKLGQPVMVMSNELGREVSMAEVFDEAVRAKLPVKDVMAELGIK